MESSEDDAGTATNASRRASAREKDVGLAEDVNATSSFQQKSSEFRSPCQTAAMSEDNFDGDSVPSPSSQDVNTSTEAILDMIDEIVDGPGAPRRLPLSPDIVDALNEELAETSNNLNIIQESAKSDVNISTVPEVASFVNSADSDTPLPANTDAQASQAECSTPSDKSASIVKTDSVDTLPASSSVPESDEIAASQPEVSVVSNVETGHSVSDPPSNIPSSSEEQSVHNIADNSVCESQDRTVKCVTSSDNRDNVTVESAESTSSDSSVSESKALLVEPQIRSPVRRRLVRPAPSDRPPDSTVSSTVDSQTVNISAAEQISSESITKDVTSSSDAVPTIHGNVKPEEISNVSEINFCKAETSMSPPKKIKLIRQKNITGTSNRETPLNQTNVLANKEQCQSTSSDYHSVNLPDSESSTIRLSQSLDDSKKPLSDSNIVLDKIPESAVTVSSEEHSQPRVKFAHSPRKDESDGGKDREKIESAEPNSQNPPECSVNDVNACSTEKAISSLSTTNLPKSLADKKENDIEQGNSSTTHDSQHNTLDYIPLTLPPTSNEVQSNSSKLKSTSCELGTRDIETKLKSNECEIKSTLVSKKSEPLSIQNDSETSNTALESSTKNVQTKSSVLETQISELESKNTALQLQYSELESKSSELDSRSCELESKISKLQSSNSVLQSRSDELESNSSPCALQSTDNKPKTSSQLSSKSSEKTCQSQPQTISTPQESISSETSPKSSSSESESSNLQLSSCEHVSITSENESKSSKSQTKSRKIQSEVQPTSSEDEINTNEIQSSTNMPALSSSISESSSTVPVPRSTEIQSTSKEAELQSSEMQSNKIVLVSQTVELDSKLTEPEPKVSEAEPLSNTTESGNFPVPISSEIESQSIQTDSTTMEIVLESYQPESKPNELSSNSSQPESRIPELKSNSNLDKSKISEFGSRSSQMESVTEIASMSNKPGLKTAEVDSSSSQPEAIIPEIESKTAEFDSKSSQLEMKTTEVKSKTAEIDSKRSHLETKTTEVESTAAMHSKSSHPETTEVESKTAVINSKSSHLETKTTEVQSKTAIYSKSNHPETTEVESKTAAINSKSSHPETKTTGVESKTAEIVSKSSQPETKILELESKTAEIDSKTSKPETKTTEIESKTAEIVSKSSQPGTKATEVESTVNVLVSQSNQPELEITEVKSLSSELELKDAKLVSKSSTLESINSEVEPMSIDSEPQSSDNSKSYKLTSKNLDKPPKPIESQSSVNCQPDTSSDSLHDDHKKVPPIKLNLSRSSKSSQSESKPEEHSSINKNNVTQEEADCTKHIPKLTIKLKQPEEAKSPVPKVTFKPLRPPVDQDMNEKSEDVPSVTKLNIKPIVKPVGNVKDRPAKSEHDSKVSGPEQLPSITKLNIKPILKPPEKINDIHRKSSSSEISESECSENDETTSTSDQASTSDNGSSEVIPKVTIKLGKPGTESEGKFYTEKNVPKLTIKGIQQDEKLIISQSDDVQPEKVPKLTIKTVTKTEGQPLSPKLTIKPLKPPDTPTKDKVSNELFSQNTEGRESSHVPKITIKPVTRSDSESRTPKKSTMMCDSSEHIPVVTKLNIKPILKPTDSGESSEDFEEKVPVVSKLNIKPVIKPKDNDIDSNVDDVPKITKLNIKPIKNPGENSSEDLKDCDELKADVGENSIPVVTKINIKPIIKPHEEEKEKDSENLSSETGNSSDDNNDHIPVVTKLNIKPIVNPDEKQESSKLVSSTEQSIPIVTKLNIKPLVKPGQSSPSSPKKEHTKSGPHSPIPVVTKLNIKPVVRPEGTEEQKCKNDSPISPKNPPLLMKINMKSVTENVNHESSHNENTHNDVSDGLLSIAPKVHKMTNEVEKPLENKEHKSCEVQHVNDILETRKTSQSSVEKPLKINCVPDSIQKSIENVDRPSINKKVNLNSPTTRSRLNEALQKQHSPKKTIVAKCDSLQSGSPLHDSNVAKEGKLPVPNETHIIQENKNVSYRSAESTETSVKQSIGRQKVSAMKNCTLLKKLLENTRDNLDKNLEVSPVVNCGVPVGRSESTLSECKSIVNSDHSVESGKSEIGITASRNPPDNKKGDLPEKVNDLNKSESVKPHPVKELSQIVNDNISNPLEITISDKITHQGSGQDSPRIILKINKTDHGSSAKIITDEVKRPDTTQNYVGNTQDVVNDKQSSKKHISNIRKKQALDAALNLTPGKRLRSSRIVENTEKSQVKKNVGKRPSTETTTPQSKEAELSMLQSKRCKLGQLLSGNKSLSITPVLPSQTSPTKTNLESKPVKTVNHSLLNNENCSKNGNSKLHNILSNLQAKQKQSLAYNNTNCSEIVPAVPSDLEFNASMSSSDTVEIAQVENSHPELQQMIINENSDFRDYTAPEEVSQDPLEVDSLKTTSIEAPEIVEVPQPLPVQLTPQPKKRGRPRKIPLSEGAKPVVVTLPVPALEERPQRSLRLMRDRPTILQKPRGGRGRGRGGRRSEATPPAEPETVTIIETVPDEPTEERPTVEIDPMSSRIKLPRMTEALDKMPSVCQTPLSSRRRNSSGTFSVGDTPELKSILDSSPPKDEFPNTPEPCGSGRPKAGPGSRGGRGRTPRGRGRGRGRGGGRGAMYMKETLGIYGRVCGPATTTVQLFEEETCMMDDNATPAKPSHLLDEDSQSSVKSSTNESSKMKKSKFADLFDSNKVWTAADVKEYTWPPYRDDPAQKVMMIQEQVAMFLGVKSFKRRYPELQRRTIGGEERDYVLSKGLVTEALCDLGITAVDASEVLDIMLSDYPHKYEEFRSYQRQKQLTETEETIEEPKPEEKPTKIELKADKPVETKPELPKVDPEKARQEMAAAAIASAVEWNARANASRRGACVDLQSNTVQRPRAPPAAPRQPHVRPPAGFYPHALLPGQYQHSYRLYTPEQLRYFPLNTVLAAPPAPPSVTESSSESEPDWGSRCSSSDDSDGPTHHSAKRKKLTKVKRSSAVEAGPGPGGAVREEEAELCRACGLRLEANRKYTHERFLTCARCNAKLHPGCVDLNADTIRKCREYPWQCAECKTCCSCRQPKDDDKMLFCDLCDRGFHIYCVGLDAVPSGRWHCVECAVCKSCGARSPSGPAGAGGAGAGTEAAAWHHQTRRGPGGHKVYSHSLCTPCARAYRIGRYCPLCERSFVGPKGTMQLVICKLCDRQLHQECVRQTTPALRVLDYTCAECRRGGITSRAAAVRLAPRTIATLFMAKRRFNKYAHRQYMQSRLRPEPSDPADPADDARDPSDGDTRDDDTRDADPDPDPLDGADPH